ncbi:DUF943 family protein [Enterobacter quasiroggenkampii]|uniref:DUF943 family protein n=1 Tax=Enterobacter quasiroggenkampii TaxID=2497436 RepID=UPI0021D223D6|nr:DUF943 family protein [Enterobacter quasiroggenkampii]MCU6329696.1 DUF943 family protein [Enterobacter quasiroggenkampii]MCU6399780.1 DUF943 family protein [Enterobacter quasiroggenkampii]
MNKRLTAGVVAVAVCGYLLWQFFTPVEIVAVHDGNTILVRHFPYLKGRQIAWWETNKDQIQAKYGIPSRGEDDYYSVVIMDFGEGYRIDGGTDEDSDLLCFDDMSVNERCIEKKPRLWIRFSENTGLFYR